MIEFNSTIRNQLSGKSLPHHHDKLPWDVSLKLSLLGLVYNDESAACRGVLFSRKVVAFPKCFWSPDMKMNAMVPCFPRVPISAERIELEMPVPSQDRISQDDNIIEVAVSSLYSDPNRSAVSHCACVSW